MRSIITQMGVFKLLICLLLVFGTTGNRVMAAQISGTTGSHLLITLNTTDESANIVSNANGYVITFSAMVTGTATGVTVNSVIATITAAGKALYPEIRIVNQAGVTGTSVKFNNSVSTYTNSWNIELYDNPQTVSLTGTLSFIGNSGLKIVTQSNVSLGTNNTPNVTFEDGDFEVSANMQPTEGTRGGPGFSMWGNARLQTLGSGSIKITARSNAVWQTVFGGPIVVGIYVSDGSVITGGIGGTVELNAYSPRTPNPLWDTGSAMSVASNSNNPSMITSKGANVIINVYGGLRQSGLGVGDKGSILVDSTATLTINAYGSSTNTTPNSSSLYGLMVSGSSLSTRGRIGSLGTGDVTINGYGGGKDTVGSCIGILVGYANNNQTFPGLITANGGLLRIKGVGSTVSNGVNQHGVMVVGNNAAIESKGGKLIIEGIPGTGTGGGYGLVVHRGGLITTTANPADIDIIVPSMANFNGTSDFLNVGSGKSIRILPSDPSTDFELGKSAASLNGKLGLTANDLTRIKGTNAAKLILGGSAHTGDFVFQGNVNNANIDVEAGGAGSSILPLGDSTDYTSSSNSWSFANGAKMKFNLTNNTPDSGYDRFVVNGDFNLSGLSVLLSGSYVPSPQDTLTLVTVSGSLTGQFSNRAQGAVVNVNGKGMRFHYSSQEVLLIDTTPAQSPNPQVTLTASNNNAAVCPGTAITFTATEVNGGTSPTYTFFKNNVQVQSGSNATWTLSAPVNGDIIKVILTSSIVGLNPNKDTSDNLILTVKSVTSSTTNQAICASALPFVWNGLTFTAAGSQTKTGLTNAAGCDSSATLNLTVKQPSTSTTNQAVCASALPFVWNGLTFTAAGSQTKTGLTNAAGCDSSATLNLTVKQPSSSTSNLAICPAQLPYVWNGLTFTAAGSQTKTGLTNASGCDSSATLNLSIQSTDSSVTNLSICASQLPYSWNGLTFTAAGTQTKTGLSGSLGCDSAATLVLTVKNPSSSSTNLAICDSELPYSWNGLTFTAAGSQTKTGLTNAAGCDSTATLNLAIKSSSSSLNNLTICDNQLPYVWNGLTFTGAGLQTKTGLTNSEGCDSSATLVLTVTPTSNSTTNLSICTSALPYVWNGLTFNAAGTQTKTNLTNAAGCDSSATLVLSVYSAYGDTLVQQSCVAYTWHGSTYTQSGFYQDTLSSTVGCDSIVSLQLTIRQPDAVNVNQTACGSYSWNSLTYTTSGVYIGNFINQYGCDSIVTLSLTINPNLTPTVSLASNADTICVGSSVTFTATATNGGASPSYDYKVNGISVQNGPSNSYTTTSLANSDTIVVVLTANNTCQTTSTANSNSKVLTVNPILTPSVTISASDDTICSGTSVTFTANAINPGLGSDYEFYVNGNSVQSGNSTTYTSSVLSNLDSVWVVLSPTNRCQSAGSVSSSKVKITVNTAPSITFPSIADLANSADSITLSPSPAGGSLTGPGLNGLVFRPYLVDTGLVTLTYTLTNAQGCVGSQSRSFRIFPDAIVWDGSQWKYGTPGATQGSRDLMVLTGTSPAIPNGSVCRNLVLRGGFLTHSLNNLLTINENLNLRGGLMTGGGTLRFVNAAAIVTASNISNEFRADIEIPSGANVQSNSAFRLASGSNVMSGTGTPNGGGTTTGIWTLVQRGSTQTSAWNAFSSPVLNGTGRMIQGLQHFRFDVPTQTWQAWDSNLVMTPGRGYISRLSSNGWYRGTLHNGNYSYAITKNVSGSSWNLIGNPYPSQLSWSDFLAANLNINGTAYFMKSNVNVNNVVNDYTAINGLMIGAEVPVSQGFFVEANANGNVSFTNSMRRAGRTAFYTKTNQNVDLIWLKAYQQSDSAQASTTVVGFKADATTGFDRMYDGRLLKGDGSLFMYSLLNQEPMAIQGLPTLTAPVIVPLGVDASNTGTVVFRLDSTNMDPTVRIFLEDLQTSTTQNLRQSAYQAQVTAGQSQTGRFRLLVNPFATTTPTITNTSSMHLYAYGNTLVIDQLEGRRLKEVRITDLSGRMIENWQQPQGESRVELTTTAAQGAYLMTAITTDGAITTERVVIIPW